MNAFPTRGSASASLPVSAVSLRNILPSDHMVSANLGPVKIQHPENWAWSRSAGRSRSPSAAVRGRGMFLRSPSPFPDAQGQPQVERDWLVTVSQSDGSMIFMIFVAPEPDFNHLKPTFEAMVKSVQFR
jgi:hypothetical protein